MFSKNIQIKSDLITFIALAGILLTIGLLFVYSASSVYALEQTGCAAYYLKKQIMGILLGILACTIARYIPFLLIETITPLAFFSSLLLTGGTLVPHISRTIHGSSRWLSLGGLTFQPSELLKITFILYCAYFLSKREHKPFTLTYGYIPFFIIIASTAGILLQQPDFGLSVTLAITAGMMLFISHFPFMYLSLTFLACMPALAFLIIKQPYRLQRVMTFLNPWQDPQGAGFQIIQSLIAIGSGGWWGNGISHSKQKFFYLPMQHTDFIFSIIAEETGFIGVTFLVVVYLLFLYFGCKIAWQLKKSFHIYATLGFTFLITLQALINICVANGLLPTKGIGLPFVSYGNSSLICTCTMLGLIANMVDTIR